MNILDKTGPRTEVITKLPEPIVDRETAISKLKTLHDRIPEANQLYEDIAGLNVKEIRIIMTDDEFVVAYLGGSIRYPYKTGYMNYLRIYNILSYR